MMDLWVFICVFPQSNARTWIGEVTRDRYFFFFSILKPVREEFRRCSSIRDFLSVVHTGRAAHSTTLLDDRLSLTRVRQPRAISRSLASRPSNGVARSRRIAFEDRWEINHCQRENATSRRTTIDKFAVSFCNDTICRKCNMCTASIEEFTTLRFVYFNLPPFFRKKLNN